MITWKQTYITFSPTFLIREKKGKSEVARLERLSGGGKLEIPEGRVRKEGSQGTL